MVNKDTYATASLQNQKKGDEKERRYASHEGLVGE